MNLYYDPKSHPILVVDDDADIVATFRFNFEREFTVLGATDGTEALRIVQGEPVAVIICDQRMPDMPGVEVLRRALEVRPGIVPIVLTGFTDYQELVRAMNLGSIFRYVAKPFDSDELRQTLLRAIERFHLVQENTRLTMDLAEANERLAAQNAFLKERQAAGSRLDAIVGASSAMSEVLRKVRIVANKTATVLLQGPTGTGKERIACAIHQCSDRRDELFVPVNCGAITESLLESELFGHKRGAFTGALADRKGVFQLADRGTLFLDEIGESSPAFQIHLLRVLEERRIRPVGSEKWIDVDVRVIAATNRNLEREVREGRFREDLFFRLKVFSITLPSLSERREDISALVGHFLSTHARQQNIKAPRVSAEAMGALESREYRGNVRELANLLEQALILSDDGSIELEHLFDGLPPSSPRGATGKLQAAVERLECSMIAETLQKNGGRRKETAEELGISPKWLREKMKRYGLGTAGGNGDGGD